MKHKIGRRLLAASLTALLMLQPLSPFAEALGSSDDTELLESTTSVSTSLDIDPMDDTIIFNQDDSEQGSDGDSDAAPAGDVSTPDDGASSADASAGIPADDDTGAASDSGSVKPDDSTDDADSSAKLDDTSADISAPDASADVADDGDADAEPEETVDSDTKVIVGFEWDQRLQYTYSETLEDIYAELPTTVAATLSDGTTEDLPAVWNLDPVDQVAFLTGKPYEFALSYWMQLPEGYELDPALDLTYMPNPHVSLKYTSRGIPDADYISEDEYGIATQAAVTVSSWSAGSNMIVDTGGSTVSTRYYHKFDDDQKDVYCIAQGKENPNGVATYYHDGTANGNIAAVIDKGYPACYDSSKGAYVINGVSLNADQARQATQFAVWCFTNGANKHTVSPTTMRARTGTTGSDASFKAGKWLYEYASANPSPSIYNIWRPYDSSYQAVVSTTNLYVPTGTLYVQKNSNNSSIPTTGSYSLDGALFYVYSDYACTNKVGELTTGTTGKSTSYLTVSPGTYYAKEVRAPNNYALHQEPYGATVTAGGSATINAWDAPITGSISLTKTSASTTISNSSDKYSLKGAVYTVYNSSGTAVRTMTTDANGKASCSGLWVGTYTVKETTASPGYQLDSKTYTVTVRQDQYASNSENGFEIAIRYDKRGWLYGRITSSNISKYSSYRFALWIDDQTNLVWYQGTKVSSDTYDFSAQLGAHKGTGGTLYVHCYGYSSSGTATFAAGLGQAFNYSNPSYGVDSSETPKQGYIKLSKTSSNPAVTNNNSNFSLQGAVYNVYTNSACTDSYKKTSITTGSDGTVTTGALPLGTYYVKEQSAPKGYKVDTAVHSITISDASTYTLSVQDEPAGGWLEIQKSSSLPDITNGNPCYTLQGAVYGVYKERACTNLITSLTTNASGYVKSGLIANLGTVYVKEITAPKGYELDTTVYSTTISSGGTTKLNVSDEPGNDPIGITLTKIQKYPNQYIPSLEGAEFTVKYYAGQYSSTADLPATATRTWVIGTQQISSGNKTVYMTALDDKYKVSGDAFYYNADKSSVVVPIGTLTIQETKAPEGYTLSGGFLNDTSGGNVTDSNGVILLHITQENLNDDVNIVGGNYYTQEEEFQYCSLTINKKDSGGNALAGAKFKLQILNPDTGVYDDLTTGTTDSNGQVKFEELVFGKYRVIEVATAGNASLMADPIEVTLPVTTAQDAGGSDPTYTKDGTSYYCDVTFTVQNGVIVVPYAGAEGMIPMMLAGFGVLSLAAAMVIVHRRKRNI